MVAFAVGWFVGRITPSPPQSPPSQASEDGGAQPSIVNQVSRGLRTGLTDVVDDTAPWILAGLGIAALVAPFLEHGPLAAIPGGP